MSKYSEMKPVSVIQERLGIEPNGPVQKYFTNRCYQYMLKYIPRDFGDLRSNVDIGDDYIVFESPYARYQYYGQREDGSHKINPEHYTTPGTGPYWDKEMVSADMQDLLNEVQRYVKYFGG